MNLYRNRGFYEKYIKRLLDIICSLLAIIVFCWLYFIIAVIVRIIMGSPVIFKQPRPGIINNNTGQETIFDMYKFRTMTNERDSQGRLKPDAERLTSFGKMLRATSLDELPEVINILKGEMSVIGPRPQLVRDMVFMSNEQRMRHTVKPGLTGLAQVKGRNAIKWEEKINWDLIYIRQISLMNDVKILFLTIKKVICHEETSEELEITDDYGDYLLNNNYITKDQYDNMQVLANSILSEHYSKVCKK